MNCQKCGGKTEIIDTEKYSMYVWRRRRCLECNHRMNTHENFVEDAQNSRSKAPRISQPKPEPQPKPEQKPRVAEVKPLPVRNARKQIETLREYLESKREDTDEE